MHYRHLSQEERYQISALMDAGHTLRSIALRLGRPASTISREVRRNRAVRPYQPQTAILLAAARRQHSAANARRVPDAAWSFAMEKLRETWSPEQIAGYQRVEGLASLSHESIYQRIYEDKRQGGNLHLALRHHKQRRKRRGVRERRGTIPNQVSIEKACGHRGSPLTYRRLGGGSGHRSAALAGAGNHQRAQKPLRVAAQSGGKTGRKCAGCHR